MLCVLDMFCVYYHVVVFDTSNLNLFVWILFDLVFAVVGFSGFKSCIELREQRSDGSVVTPAVPRVFCPHFSRVDHYKVPYNRSMHVLEDTM